MGFDSMPKSGLGVAPQTGQPRNYRQLGPHVPRSPSGEQAPLLLRRQLGYTFQVHLDARLQGRHDLLGRTTEDRDIEVDANRFPTLPVSVRKASERQSDASSGLPSLHRATTNVNIRQIAKSPVVARTQDCMMGGKLDAGADTATAHAVGPRAGAWTGKKTPTLRKEGVEAS